MLEYFAMFVLGIIVGAIIYKKDDSDVYELNDKLKTERAKYEHSLAYYKKLCRSHVDDKEKLKEIIKQYNGIDRPFICGGSADKDKSGLTSTIFVCPAMGADGFAIYEMKKPYSAPEY